MITISLCMIVRDEEPVLARCLESVRGIPDEIIIVDTGSLDRTKTAAAAYTDLVYDFPWADDFALARNYSFSKASMDYILWLDADDVMEEPDRQAFLRLKEELDPRTDVVMMPYHVALNEKGEPVFSYERERLLKREKGFRWEGAVHEAIQPAGVILHSPIAVSHRKEQVNDPDRNLRIFEKLLASGQRLSPRHQYYYGRELAGHGRYEEAARVFTEFLDSGQGWEENCAGACLSLSECLLKLGKKREALEALARSFAYGLPRPEICCAMGNLSMEKGELSRAIYWYKAAMSCPPEEGGFCQAEYRDIIPLLQLCVCYDRMGDYKEAYACHERCRRLRPDHPSVKFNESYFAGLREIDKI